jgi:hypothetical protein
MSDNDYDWTTTTWRVESCDGDIGLLTGDEVIFTTSEEPRVRVQNRNFDWGTGCVYETDSRVTVSHGTQTFLLVRSGNNLTCTLTPPPAEAPMPFFGLDPGRPARGNSRRGARRRAEVPARSEFPILGSPPSSSWTAIEGGG